MNGNRDVMNMPLDDIIAQRKRSNLKSNSKHIKQKRTFQIRKPGNQYRGKYDNRNQFNNGRSNKFARQNNHVFNRNQKRRMDVEWKHDQFLNKNPTANNLIQARAQPTSKPAQNQVHYEARTQIFVGGLDPSVDRETLTSLFNSVPNLVSVDMDMTPSNTFKGTAAVTYKTRNDAEAAVNMFNNQSLEVNNISSIMNVKMLGPVISTISKVPTAVRDTGFMTSAMDNPDDPRFGADVVPTNTIRKGRGF